MVFRNKERKLSIENQIRIKISHSLKKLTVGIPKKKSNLVLCFPSRNFLFSKFRISDWGVSCFSSPEYHSLCFYQKGAQYRNM